MKVLYPHQTLSLLHTTLAIFCCSEGITYRGESCSFSIRFLASAEASERLASFCHNTTKLCNRKPERYQLLSHRTVNSYHTVTTLETANLVLIWITPIRERLRRSILHCTEIRNTLVTARALTLFTSFQTQSLKYLMPNIMNYNCLKIA